MSGHGCVLPAALGSVFLFTISYQQQRTILERNTTRQRAR